MDLIDASPFALLTVLGVAILVYGGVMFACGYLVGKGNREDGDYGNWRQG